MRIVAPTARRQGGTAVITVLMLTPLLLVVAFAIDLNNIWRTDAELQDAADAAALAAAARLIAPGLAADPSTIDPTTWAAMKKAAADDAVATAQAYVQKHQAGSVSLVLNADDVQVGYIADVTAKATASAGQFQTGATAFPNSVQLTVRRDATVSSGPLTLVFGGMFGTPSSSLRASATATLRSQTITGFNGANSGLLPIAIDAATYNWLRGTGSAPAGAVAQDLYTVRSPTESGLAPPANISSGPDGVIEGTVYTGSTAPGNFGLVSLRNGKTSDEPDYAAWIQNGPSAADLATFGAQGLQAGADAPLTLYGGPGYKAALNSSFQTMLGKPRVMMLYDTVGGKGSNATYQMVGFAGATVVAADLTGANPSVTIQLTPMIDTAAVVSSGGPSSGQLIYTGVVLSR